MSSPRKNEQVSVLLQRAAQLHSAGKLAEAEPLYRQALNRSPDNFDAVHLYGVLLSQTRRFDQAETFLRRAVYLKPNSAVAHSNLGNLLRDASRASEALPHLRRAVELDPKMPAAHQNLGVVLNGVGQSNEAEKCFRTAVALAPNFPEALNSLGGILRIDEKLEESEACYRKAIALRPNYAEAHTGLGATLAAQHRNEESLASCRHAVDLRPDFPEAHSNLGMALLASKLYEQAEVEVREALRLKSGYVDAQRNLGSILSAARRNEESLEEYRKALQLDAKNAEIWTDMGSVLRNLRRFDEAKEACRRAIELKPAAPLNHYNLGVVHLDLCEIEQAIACFGNAVEVKPTAPLPHWGLALALLAHGDYTEGWREYEWRWKCSEFYPPRPEFAQPAWDGSNPAGKTILIYSEQGLGDAIQFVRYASLLAGLGARVIVQCQPSLRKLLTTLPGVGAIHCKPEPEPLFDVHCSLLSLPTLLGTTLATIPAQIPYLFADSARVEVWKQKLALIPGKLKVGIAWAGNPDHQRDHDRSCGLSALAPLAKIADVVLVSLQKGSAASQAASPPPGMSLHDFTSELPDFSDTAALIAALDLIIAVDTSVAHLAGAMGKPVWNLLAFAPDWRWLLQRTDTPWYPTMRLFRQPAPGNWSGAIKLVVDALGELS